MWLGGDCTEIAWRGQRQGTGQAAASKPWLETRERNGEMEICDGGICWQLCATLGYWLYISRYIISGNRCGFWYKLGGL